MRLQAYEHISYAPLKAHIDEMGVCIYRKTMRFMDEHQIKPSITTRTVPIPVLAVPLPHLIVQAQALAHEIMDQNCPLDFGNLAPTGQFQRGVGQVDPKR